MNFEIREVHNSEIDLLIAHLDRHFKELGEGGIPVQPYSETEPFNAHSYKLKILKRWLRAPPDQGPWCKTWGLFVQGAIYGHIEITGLGLAVLSHRAKIGLGVEQPLRGQGVGIQLLRTAIEWSQKTPYLNWLDLDVFIHNHVAIHLYEKMGFKVTGMTPDGLRVGGQSIDDLHMALDLRTKR